MKFVYSDVEKIVNSLVGGTMSVENVREALIEKGLDVPNLNALEAFVRVVCESSEGKYKFIPSLTENASKSFVLMENEEPESAPDCPEPEKQDYKTLTEEDVKDVCEYFDGFNGGIEITVKTVTERLRELGFWALSGEVRKILHSLSDEDGFLEYTIVGNHRVYTIPDTGCPCGCSERDGCDSECGDEEDIPEKEDEAPVQMSVEGIRLFFGNDAVFDGKVTVLGQTYDVHFEFKAMDIQASRLQ